jgi:EAL domain-containing protein (putative c-di-GMP-specific phosphodiesterase class I)
MRIRIAVDDFGTSYSSLSYLREFPIDILKIDRSFINQITADCDGSTMVDAIISMGKSLKHVVVAEGVKTQDSGCTFKPTTVNNLLFCFRGGITETLIR